jgi:CelD/BcsL family acetyltransferase involved in cellulose biosynthesis
MSDYRADIISNLNDWEQIRGPWNDLLENSASSNVFLTWEWLHSWAECFLNEHRELFIVVVYEGEAIVGIAPWYINKITKGICSIRQIEFIGTPEAGSDYLDVPIKKGREKEVTRFLYDFLLGDALNKWDRFRFHDIPSNSLFLLHLLNNIRENGKYVSVSEASFCPVAFLAGTEDEFFAGISSKRRQRFKQDLRTLNKQETVDHLSYSSDNLETALKDFFILYAEKAGRPGEDLHRLINNFVDKRGNESVQIDFLSSGGGFIGGLLHLRFQDTLYMYLMAIDKTYSSKVSIGNLMVGLCISNAIRSGITSYDFLKGDEDYKFHWTNSGRRSSTVLFSKRKLVPVCFTLADIAKSAGKLILR